MRQACVSPKMWRSLASMILRTGATHIPRSRPLLQTKKKWANGLSLYSLDASKERGLRHQNASRSPSISVNAKALLDNESAWENCSSSGILLLSVVNCVLRLRLIDRSCSRNIDG